MARRTRRVPLNESASAAARKLPKSTHVLALIVISISTALAFGFPLNIAPTVPTTKSYQEFALPLPPLSDTPALTALPAHPELPALTNTAVKPALATMPKAIEAAPRASPQPNSLAGWYDATVQAGDTVSLIFDRLGLQSKDLYAVLDSSQEAKALERVFPGQQLKVRLDDGGDIIEIIYQASKLEGLRILRDNDSATFTAAKFRHKVEKRRTFAAGSVQGSLYQSALEAGLSPSTIIKMGKIFAWKIDLSHVKPGDTFTVIYEQDYYAGELIEDGAILAAEFVSSGTPYRAIGFRNEKGALDYFTPEGNSLKQAFTRNPVDFTRISSGFQPDRWHPVLGVKRPHRGVDYAAPTGTPVSASGDGVVRFIGRKGGYGNTVIIDHGHGYTTLYGHLSKFKKGLKRGRRVAQDQEIGYVGSSGLATGPHLHYEFRVNGQHKDPVTVALPAEPINPHYREQFMQHAAALNTALDQHRDTLLAQLAPAN